MALHLKFALNLDTIADEMIDEISKKWKNPFDAPVLIFSDYKLEQWFRLKWTEKKGVLANLNRKSLDRFLFEILGGDDPIENSDGETTIRKKLSADMLRNVIVAYIQNLAFSGNLQGNAEKFYGNKKKVVEELDEKVAEYLFIKHTESESTIQWKLDDLRLFDFSSKMATLFLEYETSRPSNFLSGANGILDCWKEGNLQSFFLDKNKKEMENESWERQLYSKIFHRQNGNSESLLTEAFKKVDSQNTYLTLPFMYKACQKNGKTEFLFPQDKPVFILGLSGMGQFYRVVLQDFAKNHEVFAYIQNPCMEFWEDLPGKKIDIKTFYNANGNASDDSENLGTTENELLRAWGRAGRDNIGLWCLADDYQGGFGEEVKTQAPYKETLELYGEEKEALNRKEKTLLSEIQRMVAHRDNQFSEEFEPKCDSSLTLTAAPNPIREVESIHSRICQLLLEGASIRDILVVCPQLSDYRSAIQQVFDQCEKGSEEGVHLPFVIVDSDAQTSFVGNALANLFAVKKKKALSRLEFFALMRNPVVQEARGIDPNEISYWEKWISGMNVYRDHTEKSNAKEDWLDGVKRLLLSRLTDNCVGEYMPYADMQSADDGTLNRFADAVESLENWIQMPELQGEDFEILHSFREFLNSWLSMPNPPKHLTGETIVLQSVLKAFEDLKYLFALNRESISWNLISQVLQNAAQSSEYSYGSPFINGVTFMKFAPNRTIPVKHLFFMGANAKDFPGAQSFDSLDLRKNLPWKGDDTPVEKNRYAFLCQLMSTGESFHISYQNMYLPKDEELYPSSVVNDLKEALQKALNRLPNLSKELSKAEKLLPEIKIDIDETRPSSELFTAREHRNKMTREKFNQENRLQSKVENIHSQENFENHLERKNLPEMVTAYSIRQFLEFPFAFQVNKLLGLENTEENPEKIPMEPIELNALENSSWLKALVSQKLGIALTEKEMLDKEKLILAGKIPAVPFGDLIWEKLEKKAEEFASKIKDDYQDEGWKFLPCKVECHILQQNNGEEKPWTLVGNVAIVACKGNEVELISVKNRSFKDKDYLENYAAALALVREGKQVKIRVYSVKDKNEIEFKEKIVLENEASRSAKATEILQNIYNEMNVQSYRGIFPFSLRQKSVESIAKFKEELSNADEWKYFAGKDLFDLYDSGIYSEEERTNFSTVWMEGKEKMKKLLPDFDFEKAENKKGK